ncbi:unnamed protein product [Spirodela intermedia]|uniref:Sphingomyelin synthase-like domain-containing protein n=1 Tax=Spirodela intermedia TaxID=51605 RepID=A0A7I8JE36_SPIIN|nr:unnamed protein product [Spirodela intermedia]CAA6667652.1 unnamed protein product [Spirodela intermedia]
MEKMERRRKRKVKVWSLPRKNFGLGLAAISYVCVDYLREVSPWWHSWLQPALWAALALASLARAPFYKHWSLEMRAAIPFVASMVFMLAALLCEALSVRFVTAVLGLDWHNSTPPLPDTGQWLLLALNERLPPWVVEVLRAHIIGLHHYLMLFMMLAFSVLFDSVKAPGLGLGARYMFTMAVGRLLRAATFVSTILPLSGHGAPPPASPFPSTLTPGPRNTTSPSPPPPTPSAASFRPTSSPVRAVFPGEHRPDWGRMSFLVGILRPTASEGPSWYHLLKKAGGGCNDLLYSGHMLVAVLTAMAWQEAYGGGTSAVIWLLVLHSAQREVRERHHYSADCVVAVYVGVLLWRQTAFLWSASGAARRLKKMEEMRGRLVKALLEEVELAGEEDRRRGFSQRALMAFGGLTVVFALSCVLLAFSLTNDG